MTVKAKVDAIDRFVRTLKSGGLYDDINAACIMAGWTNLAGALYPLKGAAPTNVGFLAADLDAGIGLKGDGSSKYLNSNRAENADPQDDAHITSFLSSLTGSGARTLMSSAGSWISRNDAGWSFRRNQASSTSSVLPNASRFVGVSRASASGIDYRVNASSYSDAKASSVPSATNFNVFRFHTGGEYVDATLSWYSIGTATDLAALDSAVSTLMADLRAIDEDGFEPETVNYLRAVEAADGSFLETGVKQAINRFIVGCKKDGIWDAIKASCILCGARTIAGALVPLAGTAPTSVNFASGDYNRETGLKGDGTTKNLSSNLVNGSSWQNDAHMAVYRTDGTLATGYQIGTFSGSGTAAAISSSGSSPRYFLNSATGIVGSAADFASTGLFGQSRADSVSVAWKSPTASGTGSAASSGVSAWAVRIFSTTSSTDGSAQATSDARLAFYSVGSSLSLSALDARVTTLVSEIAAAIP